jgi:hypothetical protein
MKLQRFLAFATVGVTAFLAGIAIPRWKRVTARPPIVQPRKQASPIARPSPQQLVTTFQGVRNTARPAPAEPIEEWVVIEIRRIQDAGPVHSFDYALSSIQGTEYGVGSLSLPDGIVHVGSLTGDVRILPDGRLQMGSRIVDAPSYWRCTSRHSPIAQ